MHKSKLVNALLEIAYFLLLALYRMVEAVVLQFVPEHLRYKDVKGETVLITGAGSGLGRLLAERFAKLGCRLILWDVNAKGNEETADIVRGCGAEAVTYVCDVSDRNAVYETAKRVKDEVGKVNILINNAGIVTGRPLLETPDENIIKIFHINALSHFWTCKAFLPDMIADNHGHIVSIASVAGLGGMARLTDYCSSKAAAIGFEEALRMELKTSGHTGVHSTVICPFFINTGMFKGVQSRIFPIQTPESAADQVVGAVLTNKEMAFIPNYLTYMYPLKSLLPSSVYYLMFEVFGGREAMAHFVGRDSKAA